MANSATHKKTGAAFEISCLIEVLNHFHPLTEEIELYLRNHTSACSFEKGKLILRAGQVCEHVYFIKKRGCARVY